MEATKEMKGYKTKMVAICAMLVMLNCGMVFANGTTEDATETKTLKILGPWSASEEQAFEKVLDKFRTTTGIEVLYEGVADPMPILGPRLAAGDPPNIVILGGATGYTDLVKEGNAVSLNSIGDELETDFGTDWTSQFSSNGNIYAVPVRTNVLNLLWFNPKKAQESDFSSWDSFISYADSEAAKKNYIVSAIGKASWTIPQLFTSIYAATNGHDKYLGFLAKDIAWNDPTVVDAFRKVAVFYGDNYIAGGKMAGLGTDLVDGIANVFGTNASATVISSGSWVAGIAESAVNDSLVEGKDIDYTLFPGTDAGKGLAIANADVALALTDDAETLQLISFLASEDGQAQFAPSGYVVPNRHVSSDLYSAFLTKKTMDMLASSAIIPAITASIGNEENAALVSALQAAILNPEDIPSLLDDMQKNFGKN
ncbi:MAG: ABC transporter substrate-binding protein [Spirochaetia bacterium]|jgi:alpha-glucoside transport system substrate-binding protein|nr:ABC transporter substrate-binding protein [Spirochaetia bacterium]MCH3918296.1 ABC transporter substrate-binding protein [Spirochaetia bacterium]